MSRSVLILFALIAAFVAGLVCARFFRSQFTHLQTLDSPNRAHRADLWRHDHLDRNYSVYLDGRRVYGSPDFAPRSDIPFRETLLWDEGGRLLILEVAGRRIFGYDASAGRQLTAAELLAAKQPPRPPLWEYYFESEWPGIGRVRRPEEGR
jgi:hypothetical protein